MNVAEIHKLYDYHFGINRRVWDDCIMALDDATFIKDLPYSIGSIRNHCIHMMGVDRRWFGRVQGLDPLPAYPSHEGNETRAQVRATWDGIEAEMRAFLDTLTDDDLSRVVVFDLPHRGGIKRNAVWEILVHVVNHSTDHRAQMLAMLHQLGAPTLEQDWMLYMWGQ